jgi:hypothetical protein
MDIAEIIKKIKKAKDALILQNCLIEEQHANDLALADLDSAIIDLTSLLDDGK